MVPSNFGDHNFSQWTHKYDNKPLPCFEIFSVLVNNGSSQNTCNVHGRCLVPKSFSCKRTSTLTFLQITLSLEKIPQKFISIIYSGFVVFETKVGSSLGHLQSTKAVLDLSTCNVNRAILRTCNLTFSFNFSFK
jgi:hypothetical protein